jgi:hypothetical protein
MTQRFRMAVAGSLVFAAVPALAYEEAFVASLDSHPAATVVQVGEYHESFGMEAPAAEQRQSEPVVAGDYTESFIDTGTPARAAIAVAPSGQAPARLSASR